MMRSSSLDDRGIVLHLLDAPGGPPAAREAPPEEPSP